MTSQSNKHNHHHQIHSQPSSAHATLFIRSLCRRRRRHCITPLLLGLVILDRHLDRVLGEPGRDGGKACEACVGVVGVVDVVDVVGMRGEACGA